MTILPIGQSASPASFTCAQAKGRPMMVRASTTAVMRWPSASHQPARISQIRLPSVPSGPVPRSPRPVYSSRRTTVWPNGSSVYQAMLKAARAQGRPMMVIAMMMAAMSQPTAIHQPPKMTHRTLRRRLTGDMSGFLAAASAADVAEFAVEIEIRRRHPGLHPRQPLLELGEFVARRLQRAVGRPADAAPEDLLLAARIEPRRPLWQDHRQRDIGDEGRQEEEDQTEYGGEPPPRGPDAGGIRNARPQPGGAGGLGGAV